MQKEKSNLMFKYAALAFCGGLIGAFISNQLGYNDGSLQAYLTAALAASIGGSMGGLILQRKIQKKIQKNTRRSDG